MSSSSFIASYTTYSNFFFYHMVEWLWYHEVSKLVEGCTFKLFFFRTPSTCQGSLFPLTNMTRETCWEKERKEMVFISMPSWGNMKKTKGEMWRTTWGRMESQERAKQYNSYLNIILSVISIRFCHSFPQIVFFEIREIKSEGFFTVIQRKAKAQVVAEWLIRGIRCLVIAEFC